MSYRNDVDALAARHAALESELVTKTQERDVAASLLDEAKAKAKQPILDNIRVATPCTADWNQMTGDERVRMCGACNKNVYNLSSMTRDEAESLIVAKQGSLCVRYYQRADGTILLADCTIGKRQKRKRRVMAASVAALLAGAGGLAWKLSRPKSVEPQVQIQGDMGGPRHDTTAIAGGVSFDPGPAPPPLTELKGKIQIDPKLGDSEPPHPKMGRLHR